ncbi:hypothetical protein [Rhabdothermincola sp.]|uniref:hypothetical protein n=1 Tax=Rhabdothermincola sp. TaxID=2820405 RepID=UPI002FE0E406
MNSPATTAVSDTDLAARWASWGEDGPPGSLSSRLAPLHICTVEDLTRLEALAGELGDLLERHHPAVAVGRFLGAADTHADDCDRRAALRLFERLSQLAVDPLTWARLPHPDPHARRRPLTRLERALVRHCALHSAGRTGVVGLIDSGATSGELGKLTAASFTRGVSGLAEAVDLPGTCRHTRCGYPQARPRPAEIPRWARPGVTTLVTAAGACPVLYSGRSTDPAKVQSALVMTVGAVLRDAGLAGDHTVAPMSIRNTFGRAHYDTTGDLVATAEALGHDDLMTVAREIGIRPHPPTRKRSPKPA